MVPKKTQSSNRLIMYRTYQNGRPINRRYTTPLLSPFQSKPGKSSRIFRRRHHVLQISFTPRLVGQSVTQSVSR